MPHVKQKQTSELLDTVQNVETQINNAGNELIDSDSGHMAVGLESMKGSEIDAFNGQFDSVKNALKDTLTTDVSEIGLEAAALVAMGTGNSETYNSTVNTVSGDLGEGVVPGIGANVGSGGQLDSYDSSSMEAFDNSALHNSRSETIVYNAHAAETDDFTATFWNTEVYGPDNTGVDITLTSPTVRTDVTHRPSEVTDPDFGRRNLIDATTDASILESNATDLVPMVLADNSNDKFFMAAADVAPAPLLVGGEAVTTAPLKFGVKGNILALSSGSAATAGQNLTSEDSIDGTVRLKNLFLKVANADSSATDILRFKTADLTDATFFKSPNGKGRDMTLAFNAEGLMVNEFTRNIEAAAPDTWAAFTAKHWEMKLAVSVNGTLNVETGAYQLSSTNVDVVEVRNQAGDKLPLDASDVVAILNGLNFTAAGFEFGARKSNLNHRSRGLIVDNVEVREGYRITLDRPITATMPIGSNVDAASNLRTLIATSKVRTANNGITAMFNFIDSIKAKAPVGMGRYHVKQTYIELPLDLVTLVSSDKSHEKAADVRSVIVDAMRNVAVRLDDESNYSAALKFFSGSESAKAKYAVGTHTKLKQYIMVDGDERTLGPDVDMKLVVSNDDKMKDKIIMTFIRDEQKISGLSFGHFAYVPPMTAQLQVSRGGSTVKEARVQPRQEFIPVLPVVGVINVSGLDQVMTTKIA